MNHQLDFNDVEFNPNEKFVGDKKMKGWIIPLPRRRENKNYNDKGRRVKSKECVNRHELLKNDEQKTLSNNVECYE